MLAKVYIWVGYIQFLVRQALNYCEEASPLIISGGRHIKCLLKDKKKKWITEGLLNHLCAILMHSVWYLL